MSRAQANCLLLLAAAFWGFGNVAQKTVLDHLDPLSAVGMRCLIAGLMVAPLTMLEWGRKFGPGYWMSLTKVSVLFSISIIVQQISYLDTSVTNASFLVSTATVMTPLAAWFLIGERPNAVGGLAAAMTLVGVLLLSGGLTASFSQGDLAAILSAACYALWMVELGRHMQTHGAPVATAAAQFLGAAVITLPFGALQGNLSLAAVSDAGPELAVLGIFSTGAAFGIQTIAQRFTSASHAAVIVSAESVFGAIGAAIFLGERLSPVGAVGAAVVFASITLLSLTTDKSEISRPAVAD
ncbi:MULTISPECIES: DMT family transporter [unclassified Mesorhizobium]|uniref:DMT family transporter n=1 Tax=unclassified Mesorhizobium TaxID=325217 RepID=UPI000F75A041|nr:MULTISPECIES: DMT family transporter [unclassified Mesorhizobium]AZO67293.1 EamA/RhaT family transporter [Mesorhizobium sp. M6A.T.Cr.TU.016.01.1.1]RVB77525.1 EamA/RhaT family transporter [Mesorhizobium sp. M6A.T.Cr.TU.014.01.1.1]RWN64961.1 MAG: EamA/RhaT family transporter [Mesorhizobium sp.]RWP70531.1 MAG: EamA/RhaT family transporter [Mesorhizobium sp.]RWQ02011.1 MAG: EamA/RhaT family transporter [Mesorhizobium sp.]